MIIVLISCNEVIAVFWMSCISPKHPQPLVTVHLLACLQKQTEADEGRMLMWLQLLPAFGVCGTGWSSLAGIETERGRLFYFERNEKTWWWFGWSFIFHIRPQIETDDSFSVGRGESTRKNTLIHTYKLVH